ncbi:MULTISPECIES: ABC transporter permease [Caldilinea]|uniref:Putative ABC transporter permease protein n=2 Tax=Caldilinea TaxID=233191 RepID=I0I7T0_CALAS|nr:MULTISPECIES: ABC transporter permease [Caldilinea]MBO9394374.1 ABC transporter permease [Caldilinea sp.]BAM01318.1 putative ABC transporter permease protein [Caldilinea aerophila DSM 14535 = NBRC 104270]GIV72660.1 MAG: peptide ABC transporter permease [Caldilinea sp.]
MTTAATTPDTTTPDMSKRPSFLRQVRNALELVFSSRTATVGLAIVLFWVGIGLLSLFWTPYPPNAQMFNANQPPGAANWMGTDHLGRDIWSRVMAGTQVVLLKTRLSNDPPIVIPGGVAIWGVIGAVVVGGLLGVNAGYRGGMADQIMMQILDAFIAFPVIVLYLVIVASLGRGDLIVIAAITITGAPGVARLVRGLTLDIKTREYIRAAETRGESKWYIMLREILPNARGPILVDAMLRVGYAIFAIGTLGFLGLGLPPPDPDWGSMVNDARKYIYANPLAVAWPALAIATLVIGVNLFADGLREEIMRYQR